MFLSSTTEVSMHPAYQAIIGMGPSALPFILADLRDNKGQWFWALRAITRQNPAPPEACGKMDQLRKAWLDWGRANGFLD